MHFSRPSEYRLSWWRPWERGMTGPGFSGYSSVILFLNIEPNVTPKPATPARNLGTCFLLARDALLTRKRRCRERRSGGDDCGGLLAAQPPPEFPRTRGAERSSQ